MKSNSAAIPLGQITEEELFNFIEDFPALLWRIDYIKNKIEYLNDYEIRGLGHKSGLLVQNLEFARRVVLQKDRHLLEDFMRAVRNGETAATIFRIKNDDGEVLWIKLTGTRCRTKPGCYLGFMLDVSPTARIVQSISEKDAEFNTMIEMMDYPIMLVDAADRSIVAHNAAARDLFHYKPAEFDGLDFSHLCEPGARSHINRIYEEALFEKKWEGVLALRRRNNASFMAEICMRSLSLRGKRMFRVSIYHVDAERKKSPRIRSSAGRSGAPADRRVKDYAEKMAAMIANESDMPRILQTLLDNQFGRMNFESIIYSDVYTKKNRVVVYTAGETLASLEQGEMFPYEGTIAENIDRYKLDYLIMEDTFSSIKAIDWALFIPRGLRSYFAKPFYQRKVLRTVLVLCSTHPNAFSEKFLADYALLYKPFSLGLSNWRKAKRAKKHT